MIYRGWFIQWDPPPIPDRNHDWQYWHKNYDGPGDGRIGSVASEQAAREAIDEEEDEK